MISPLVRSRIVALLVLCPVVASCPESEPAPIGSRVETSIDVTGGTVRGPAGVVLEVPANAVAQPMTIVVEEAMDGFPPPLDLALASPVFCFKPHAIGFLQPVTIGLPLPAGAATDFALVTASPGGGWQPIPNARVEGGMIRVQVPHFSYFAVVQTASLQPGVAPSTASYCGSESLACCPEGKCAPGLVCTPTSCVHNCVVDLDYCFDSYCTSTCVPLLANGDPCLGGDDCASGFCVDSVCCENACQPQCAACDVPGARGQCAPVAGVVPHGTRTPCANAFDRYSNPCGNHCDGSDVDTCVPAPRGAVCDTSCVGATATAEPEMSALWLCDGQGSCQQDASFGCLPFSCDPAAGRCRTACSLATADRDCAAGAWCDAGICRLNYFVCSDDGLGVYVYGPSGASYQSCSPYRCSVAHGGCLEHCTSRADCGLDASCSAEGHCY